jgi:hypothetical protein
LGKQTKINHIVKQNHITMYKMDLQRREVDDLPRKLNTLLRCGGWPEIVNGPGGLKNHYDKLEK